MSSINNSIPQTLTIGLGANSNSPAGSPESTLIIARPVIENVINEWICSYLNENRGKISIDSESVFSWSPLYKTKPLGGPQGQPNFVNAALVVHGGNFVAVPPSIELAKKLLKRFLLIEKDFGRDRSIKSVKWGPRSLDIDLLAWGGLQVNSSDLTLPHPRSIQRNFVIIPLAEALKKNPDPPSQIPPQRGWQE